MSNPNERLRTEEEEVMYDAGLIDGRDAERNRIIELLNHLHDEYTDDYGYTMESMVVSNAIDRIKGINR
jgi:hypothetical protein